MQSEENDRVAERRSDVDKEDLDDDKSLEYQQSGRRESERRYNSGGYADLTELAAPAPLNRTHTRAESLEIEESKARRKQTRASWSADGDEGLTEVAAPAPVEHCHNHLEDKERVHGTNSPSSNSTNDLGSEEKSSPEEPEHSEAATSLYTHSHLIFFSILGTLARLGLEAITAYPYVPFTSPVLWANLAGSFTIGFLTEDRKLFREEWGSKSEEWSFHPSNLDENDENEEKLQKLLAAHGKVKKTIPLFIGLAVGFCGSFTSFSSFLRDVFLAGIDKLPGQESGTSSATSSTEHRNGGPGFEAAIAVLVIQVAVSIGALNVGATTAFALDRWIPTLPFRFSRHILDPLTVMAGFGCWIGAIIMSIWPPMNAWRGQVTFALVFAPVGCLLRFYISKLLNTRLPAFPLGTFCVNILGTAVLSMCYDLQHSHVGGTLTRCQILDGLIEGFCGCLTTVSTWVLEMDTLRARHAYIYGLSSVAVALGFLVIIVGTLEWTRGLSTPTCPD